MSAWDQEYIVEDEEGSLEFDQKDNGQFLCGYVHGQMDCNLTTRDGELAVEWTWDGNSGSPREAGSTRPSKAASRSGW